MDHVDVFEIIGEGPASSAIVDAMIITSAKIRNYDKPLLSISGGSDSDIMLDMCWRLDPLKKITYKFVNTGIEYEATKRHIKFLEQKYGIEIEELKATIPVPLGCRTYGVPFLTKHVSEMISRLQKHNFKWENEEFEVLLERYPKCKSALKWWCNQHINPKSKYSSLNINKHLLLKEFIVQNPPDFAISPMCCEGAKKDRFDRLKQRATMILYAWVSGNTKTGSDHSNIKIALLPEIITIIIDRFSGLQRRTKGSTRSASE